MKTSLKERLKSSDTSSSREENDGDDSSQSSRPSKARALASVAAGSLKGGANKDSIVEQLEGIYKEIEYMESVFPDMTISALTDLCQKLQGQIASDRKSGSDAPDYGIIPGSVMAKLSIMTQDIADSKDVGIVEVDDRGQVLIYNRYEQKLAGVTLDAAHGKNFFHDVAPCTANRFFRGRFKQGIAEGNLDTSFEYTFTYKIMPTPVQIHMYRDQATARNFIFVKLV